MSHDVVISVAGTIIYIQCSCCTSPHSLTLSLLIKQSALPMASMSRSLDSQSLAVIVRFPFPLRCIPRRCVWCGAIFCLVVSNDSLVHEEDDTNVWCNVQKVRPQPLVEATHTLKPTQKSRLGKQRSSTQKWPSYLTRFLLYNYDLPPPPTNSTLWEKCYNKVSVQRHDRSWEQRQTISHRNGARCT